MPYAGWRYDIETFGCQMNVRDSETIAGVLASLGFSAADSREEADIIVYNTCCVRDHAEKRVFGNIGALKELKEAKPSMLIAVCGCMMQQREVAERLYRRFPYVDMVFGTNLLSRLPSFLDAAREGNRVFAVEEGAVQIEDALPTIRTGMHNAFVNINYGCNNYCTYCIVPYVRGPERSRAPEAILREVEQLVSGGYSEITLLGQNVNSYGNDLPDVRFSDLLRLVSGVDGLRRIRFMTSHPKDLSEDMIEAMATLPNVCHHVHLPMQSGSNDVLRRMNRRYTREKYLAIVDALRGAMDDVEITTDVIVGFPGETEADFLDTLEMTQRVGFASAFTFKYSPRKGTAAAAMPEQIAEEEKKARLARLNALQQQESTKNNEKYIGYSGEVHVEGCDTRGKPLCFGKYSNFKMVYFPGDPSLVGRYCRVTATGCTKNALRGKREE